MAAPDNVNSEQFDDHQDHLNELEEQHGVEFTPMGLKHSGGFIPTTNMQAVGWDGPRHPRTAGSAEPPPRSSMSLYIPTEDPAVHTSLNLYNPSSAPDHPPSGVETVEVHGYPNGQEGGQGHRTRFNWHEDVPSAIEHLRQSSQERAGHLAGGTVPEININKSSINDVFHPDNNGKWRDDLRVIDSESHNPVEIRENGLVPPSTIGYNPLRGSGPYRVDTGTRERIPE